MANISQPIGAIVVGVVIMFVGIYMVDAVDLMPVTSMYDTTTASNTTQLNLNATAGANQNLTFSSLSLATSTGGTLTVNVTNQSATSGGTIAVFVNTVFVGSISVPANSSQTEFDTTLFADGTNNITFLASGSAQGGLVNVTGAFGNYYDITNPSDFGNIRNQTVTTTGIAFSVFGLIMIVVGLAMAIRSLHSMG